MPRAGEDRGGPKPCWRRSVPSPGLSSWSGVRAGGHVWVEMEAHVLQGEQLFGVLATECDRDQTWEGDRDRVVGSQGGSQLHSGRVL